MTYFLLWSTKNMYIFFNVCTFVHTIKVSPMLFWTRFVFHYTDKLFFKITFVFHKIIKSYRLWNDVMVSKWGHNFPFLVNCPFNMIGMKPNCLHDVPNTAISVRGVQQVKCVGSLSFFLSSFSSPDFPSVSLVLLTLLVGDLTWNVNRGVRLESSADLWLSSLAG